MRRRRFNVRHRRRRRVTTQHKSRHRKRNSPYISLNFRMRRASLACAHLARLRAAHARSASVVFGASSSSETSSSARAARANSSAAMPEADATKTTNDGDLDARATAAHAASTSATLPREFRFRAVNDDADEPPHEARRAPPGATAKARGFAFFEALGNPRYHVAPMVDQSELAFRELCKRYGATLGYTPMIHARLFVESPKYRREIFSRRRATGRCWHSFARTIPRYCFARRP